MTGIPQSSIPPRGLASLLSRWSVVGQVSRHGRGSGRRGAGMMNIPQSSIPPRGIASLLSRWSVCGQVSRRGNGGLCAVKMNYCFYML